MDQYDDECSYPNESQGESMGGMGGLAYLPDLGPVGSGSSGTYYPRDTTQDARALNYLGIFPDAMLALHVGTSGSQAADMAAETGAWSPNFRIAVTDFQQMYSLSADGWIGPGTRTELAKQVALKNAREVSPPGPFPIPPGPLPLPPIPPIPPLPFPPQPGPSPAPGPGPAPEESHTVRNVGLAAAAVGLGYLGYRAWKKK